MAEIHRYDSACLQRPRHRDVGQRTLHSQPAGAHLHSARHTMREAAAEESQRPPLITPEDIVPIEMPRRKNRIGFGV